YNEEFKIWKFGGVRSGDLIWDEGRITPKRLVGTRKEYDRYYAAEGFVKNGKVGDTYGNVLIREGANEYYGAKLKELFGENILPILEVKGMSSEDYSYEIPDYKKHKEEGNSTSLEGVLIIFGRVESIADREKYREGIYKFIQYLKEKKSFDNSYLGIVVVDERFLSKDFKEEEFLELYLKDLTKTKEKYRKERRNLINKYNNSYLQTSEEEKQNKINNIVKAHLFGDSPLRVGIHVYSGRNTLLITGVYGEVDNSDREWLIKTNRILKNYKGVKSIDEINFNEEKW
ncbi:MAG: hypothetical protein ACRCVS_03905, partial [Fusobacteriaceae bacterium]